MSIDTKTSLPRNPLSLKPRPTEELSFDPETLNRKPWPAPLKFDSLNENWAETSVSVEYPKPNESAPVGASLTSISTIAF